MIGYVLFEARPHGRVIMKVSAQVRSSWLTACVAEGSMSISVLDLVDTKYWEEKLPDLRCEKHLHKRHHSSMK